jgi:hypothetical protein
MMKYTKGLFPVVAAGILALSVTAKADPNTTTTSPVDPGHPRVTEVQKRQANQQERIGKGIEKGSLTPGEATKLEKRENNIEKAKQRDMAAHNGHLTKAEQHNLNKRENHVSKDIYKKKHNAKTTGTPQATGTPAPAASGK